MLRNASFLAIVAVHTVENERFKSADFRSQSAFEVCAGRGDVRVNPGPETLGIAAAFAEGKVTHYTTGGYRCGTKRATSRRQESRSYRSQSRVAGATCVHILDCLEFKTKILRVSIHYTNLVK